jgi:hypothetical protein
MVNIWLVLKVYICLIFSLLECLFSQFLLTYASVCVFPVGFLLIFLYCCFYWRVGAWGFVCVPAACYCVSSFGA